MTVRQVADRDFHLFYPYIKQLSANASQESWLLDFYYQKIMPYTVNILESNFIAKQKTNSLEWRLYFLKEFFEFESKKKLDVNDETIYLNNKLMNIHSICQQFQNEYFNNIRQKKPGFNFDAFYSNQYQVNFLKLIQLTALFWAKDQIEQNPEFIIRSKKNGSYLKWIDNRLSRHCNNTVMPNQQVIFEPFRPSIIGYFFTGSERFFVFLQMEKYHLSLFWRNIKNTIKNFRKGKEHLTQAFFELPICALIFSLNVLFISLLPYRLLRSVVNEIYQYIKGPVEKFIESCNPRYKVNPISHFIHLLFLSLLYASLLTIFCLPIIPIPLTWVPSIASWQSLALVPAMYMALIPLVGVLSGFKSQPKFEQPKDDKGVLLHSGEFISLSDPQNKLLNRYQLGLESMSTTCLTEICQPTPVADSALKKPVEIIKTHNRTKMGCQS